MSIGRTVRLHLVEGTVSGVLTAEIMNWTGHVLAGPRSKLSVALRRNELERTGIYFLSGANPDEPDQAMVYVGEGDEIRKRLYAHGKDVDKDFWDRFICVTSKDLNLTKAHVKYLEARVLELLKSAKKVAIANKEFPRFDRLPEADVADMQSFLAQIELVLPVIGFDFLRKPNRQSAMVGQDAASRDDNFSADTDLFVLANEGLGIQGQAKEIDGEFVLLQGSTGVLRENISFVKSVKLKRDLALGSGAIKEEGASNFVVVEDIAFASPTGASVFLFGTSRNGRTDWVHDLSQTAYREWKEQQLDLAQAHV